jgi:hypothetical protein
LLTRVAHEVEFESKLGLAERYFRYSAECIHIARPQIVDPAGHLARFEEVFLSVVQLLDELNDELSTRAREIEGKYDLSQNVVRLSMVANLKLRGRSDVLSSIATLLIRGTLGVDLKVELPDKGEVPVTQPILIAIRGALTRLASVVNAGKRDADRVFREGLDTAIVEDYFDPRRIARAAVIHHLEIARKNLLSLEGVPDNVRAGIDREIGVILTQLRRPAPSWGTVFSKLTQVAVMVGGLTAFGAQIDECYANIKRAVDIVATSSLVRPQETYYERTAPVAGLPPAIAKPPASDDHTSR